MKSASATAVVGNRFERRREKTRQDLLTAATRVLAEKGLHDTKIADIATAADVGVGTFYLHFDTKEALLLGVIDHFQAAAFGRAEDALRDPALSAATRIRMVIRKVFSRRETTTGDRLLTLLLRDLAIEVPRAHERWLRDGPVRFWKLLRVLVTEGEQRGEFRADADAEVGARVLISGLMLQLMWQQHAAAVPGLAIDDDRLLDSSSEFFLAALRPVYAAREVLD